MKHSSSNSWLNHRLFRIAFLYKYMYIYMYIYVYIYIYILPVKPPHFGWIPVLGSEAWKRFIHATFPVRSWTPKPGGFGGQLNVPQATDREDHERHVRRMNRSNWVGNWEGNSMEWLRFLPFWFILHFFFENAIWMFYVQVVWLCIFPFKDTIKCHLSIYGGFKSLDHFIVLTTMVFRIPS